MVVVLQVLPYPPKAFAEAALDRLKMMVEPLLSEELEQWMDEQEGFGEGGTVSADGGTGLGDKREGDAGVRTGVR